jgi:hypothetical protein
VRSGHVYLSPAASRPAAINREFFCRPELAEDELIWAAADGDYKGHPPGYLRLKIPERDDHQVAFTPSWNILDSFAIYKK